MNNWQDLYYLYIILDKDLREIASLKGCSHEWVRYQLKLQHIPIKKQGRPKKVEVSS